MSLGPLILDNTVGIKLLCADSNIATIAQERKYDCFPHMDIYFGMLT